MIFINSRVWNLNSKTQITEPGEIKVINLKHRARSVDNDETKFINLKIRVWWDETDFIHFNSRVWRYQIYKLKHRNTRVWCNQYFSFELSSFIWPNLFIWTSEYGETKYIPSNISLVESYGNKFIHFNSRANKSDETKFIHSKIPTTEFYKIILFT